MEALETHDKRVTTPTRYLEKIDGLRFLALLIILTHHFTNLFDNLFFVGFFSVDLFFVISGFLITSILLKQNKKPLIASYTNFLGRRTLRIFPLYYLTVLTLWLLNVQPIRENLVRFLTYTYNYAWKADYAVGHFWTLCIEEQFYIFWPLIVLSLKNKQKQLTLLTISIIVLGYAQLFFKIFPSLTPYNVHGLLTRMSSLGVGALGSLLTTQNLLPRKLLKSNLFECIVLAILLLSVIFTYKLNPLVVDLCCLYLILKAAGYEFYTRPLNNFLKNKHVVHLGRITYGIYVFHLPIAYYFSVYIFDPIWNSVDFSRLGRFEEIQWYSWVIKLPLYTFLSICVASLSYRYIESPILKLKDVYFKY